MRALCFVMSTSHYAARSRNCIYLGDKAKRARDALFILISMNEYLTSNSYGDIDIGQWKIQAPVIWLCRMTALNHQLSLETERESERVYGAAGRSEACASPGTTHPQWRHADCPRPGHWTGSRAGELYGKQQGAKLSLRKGRWEGHTARHNARVGTCDQPRAARPLTYNAREDF